MERAVSPRIALQPPRTRRGFSLFVSMGMLALIGAIATVFALTSAMERAASRAYVDSVRTRMAADAGIQMALASVRLQDLRQAWSDPLNPWYYPGEDTNVNFQRDPGEPDPVWPGVLDSARVPLAQAERVSFHAGLGPDGRGYSLSLGGTYQPDGDLVALKVIDCASQINVNNFESGTKTGNPWLPRVLDRLGAITGAGALGADLMRAVVRRRGTPFQDKEEFLGEVLGGNRARFDRVKDFLTCQSWIDPDTIRVDNSVRPTLRKSPRAPINVNTASFEVLTAVFWGSSAQYRPYNYDTTVVTGFLAPPVRVTLDRAKAEAAARFIIDGRMTWSGGLYRYYDWMHFKIEVLNLLPGFSQAEKDLLWVTANPNTTFRKMNPDQIVVEPDPTVDPLEYTRLDKLDVLDGGTELTFGAMGYYEVEAHGRIYRDNTVLAEDRVRAIGRVLEVFRVTTQKQFETYRVWRTPSGTYGPLHDQGHVPVVSLPEYPFQSPAGGKPLYRSIGADETGGSANDVSWCATWDGGLTLNGINEGWIGLEDGKPPSSTRRSLVAGFGTGTIMADQAPARSDAPGYPYTMWECDYKNRNTYSPAQTGTLDTAYTWGWGTPGTRKPSVIDANLPTPGLSAGGSDLTPFGVYYNWLTRRRFHTFYGDNMPAPEATLEFLVKPEVDVVAWGRKMSNTCRSMTLLDWGPAKRPLTNYELRLFTASGRLFADFFHGNGTKGKHYVLWMDVDWPPHTWHHVELNFSDVAKILDSKGTPDASDDEERWETLPNAMLFVDGKPADMVGSGSTFLTVRNPNWTLLSPRAPALTLPEPVIVKNRGNYWYGVDPWIVVGGGMTLSVDNAFSMARCDFIGTIDDFQLHYWRQHDKPFRSKSRYHDPSYRAYSRMIDYAGAGTFLVGVYARRLREIEDVVNRLGEVTLGTVSCTHVHPVHEHIAGSHTGGGSAFGHVSPRMMIDEAGTTLFYSFYDGCAGLPIIDPKGAGWSNHVARRGAMLTFAAEFEGSDKIPVIECSYLDEFTVTYSTGIHIVNRVAVFD